MKINISIVGLTHNDIKDRCLEYAREAAGKQLKLIPDLQNPYDPLAVKAYDGSLFLGYVAFQDLEDVQAAFRVSGRKALRAQCQGFQTKEDGASGLYLEATVSFAVSGEEAFRQALAEVFDGHPFTEWHYSGPVFSIDRLARIADCTDMLEEAMQDMLDTPQGEEREMIEREMSEQLETFMANHRFDYSHEMTLSRKRIQTLIVAIDEKEHEAQREALLSEMGYIMSSGYREEAARCFFVDTPIQLKGRNVGVYDYGDRLDEIERELEAFPYDMYRKFKADPVDFLREIYYKRVPRKQMLQLLSGVILMIVHHRADDVKRWGKHNDQEALREMKELRRIKVSEEEKADFEQARQEIVDASVRRMACLYNDRLCRYVVKSQADWFPVYRVLEDLGVFEPDSHKVFSEYLARVVGEPCPEMESRPHAPVCKKKDLDQASEDVFERTKAWEWEKLSERAIRSIQSAKYNRYCDIVDKFCQLLREEESKRQGNKGNSQQLFFS